ncbi:MAG: hypothetical protein ACI8Y4_004947 [Candidatus Poriferisodalaceae bacterium]|jgi:hypothetical protein
MLYALWEIVIPLILALLVGVLIGWIIWGWRRTPINRSEYEKMQFARAPGARNAEPEIRSVAAATTPVGSAAASIVGEQHPYGEGSHGPLSDRSMPDGHPIKGNVASMLYHREDSLTYGATIVEVWFDSGARAEAAGFSLSPTHPKASTGSKDQKTSKAAAGSKPSKGQTAPKGQKASGGSKPAGDSKGSNASVASASVVGEQHPYGEGSFGPLSDRSMPQGHPIKGNVSSLLYHRQDSRNYGATTAEVWFDSPERAEAAGFKLSPTHPKPKN